MTSKNIRKHDATGPDAPSGDQKNNILVQLLELLDVLDLLDLLLLLFLLLPLLLLVAAAALKSETPIPWRALPLAVGRGRLMRTAAAARNHDAANYSAIWTTIGRASAHVSTHMATQHCNNHAAVPLRSASAGSKTPINYAHTNTPKAPWSHRYSAGTKNIETILARNRLTHELPFISCGHYTAITQVTTSLSHHFRKPPLP